MLNERAFSEAAKAFNKLRGSSVACLRAAISVYRAEELFQNTSAYRNLTFSVADTEKGDDTALVISGFNDVSQAEAFLLDAIHAQCG